MDQAYERCIVEKVRLKTPSKKMNFNGNAVLWILAQNIWFYPVLFLPHFFSFKLQQGYNQI